MISLLFFFEFTNFHRYEGGLIVNAGGETIVSGGLIVTAGGATVTAGGLAVVDGGGSISSTATGTPVLTVHASETGSAYASDVLHVKSTRASATAFNLVKASVGTTTDVFAIRGDGRVNVIAGGLLVTAGGATVVSGGVHVSDGMTIHTAGLKVVAGGATITAGKIYFVVVVRLFCCWLVLFSYFFFFLFFLLHFYSLCQFFLLFLFK